FPGNQRSALAERREDSPGVKPSRAAAGKDLLPVDVAGPQLRDCGVAAIRATDRAANSKPALGEVESVANRPPYAAIRHPLYVGLIDASLINEVLDEPADRIIRERGNDGSVQTETSFETARDVILTAAFPDLKRAGGCDS